MLLFTQHHCTFVILQKIRFLKKFTKYIGWSDHTEFEKNHHIASLASILFGSKIIERHFTILDRTKTKDGIVSITPDNAKEFIDLSKQSKSEIEYYLRNAKKNWKICINSKNKDYQRWKIKFSYYGRFAAKKKQNYLQLGRIRKLIISFIVCPNGNGHLFRTLDIIDYLNVKIKDIRINIFCSKTHKKKIKRTH